MAKYYIGFFIVVAILSVLVYIKIIEPDKSSNPKKQKFSATQALSSEENEKYKKALQPIEFKFPKDHGAHNDYKLEWWYYTGNLKSNNGREFGYQFTIFRNAITPDSVEINSSWKSNQLYIAHFGLSDIQNKKFYSYEKLFREKEGVAGANHNPFKVFIEDWVITAEYPNSNYEMPIFNIQVDVEDLSLDLKLEPQKQMALHGVRGLSQKSYQKGNASYYYSFTRLASEGRIEIENEKFEVEGFSWMDREWSTSALERDQAGWDWFSIQIENGIDIMYFQLRSIQGEEANFGKGSWVDKIGNVEYIALEDVELTVLERWESPAGNEYPVKWSLNIPKKAIELVLEVKMKNQVHDISVDYYEGAIQITGDYKGTPIKGNGYVELTGYEKKAG